MNNRNIAILVKAVLDSQMTVDEFLRVFKAVGKNITYEIKKTKWSEITI